MLAVKSRYQLEDLLDQESGDEHVYDILGGELVVWTAPNPNHGQVVANLMEYLAAARRAGYGRVFTAPCAVAFDFTERGVQAIDVTHPDVLFVRHGRSEIFGEWCLVAPPDLVVEVLSPSTRADDLPGGRKFALYEHYGVPHYWVVDLDERSITQFEWRDGAFGPPVTLRTGDIVGCPLFPGITCDTATVFADVQ